MAADQLNYQTGIKADGYIESTKNGKMVGAVTTLPTASSENNGCSYIYNGDVYTSNGTSMVKNLDHTKLSGIATGAQVNKIESVTLNGTAATITNKTAALSYTAPTLSKGTTTGSGNAVTDITVSDHTITLTKGSTFLTAHPKITTSTDSTSTDILTNGGTFSAVDSVSRDSNGHVTAIDVKTFTLPSYTVPTKVSALTNDSGYITASTSSLSNYYTKTQIDNKFSAKLSYSAVDSLPSTGISSNTIYLVKSATTATDNVRDEYMYVNSAWEKIGTTATDLADYAKKTDIPTIPTLSLGTTSGSGNAVTSISVSGHTITMTKGSTFLTAHPSVSKSTDSTSTASPAHGGTFTAIDSITRDTYGHVTKVNTKTITLPADNNTDTKVTQAYSETSSSYPVLFSATSGITSTASRGATTAILSNKIYANPNTGTLTATTFSGALSGNATTATSATSATTATRFASSQSVALTGDVTGSASSTAGWSVATTLADSGVTAGSYGPSADATPSHSGTFSVPYITVDSKGRVTAAATKSIKLPSSGNVDTKVTQAYSTSTSSFPLLMTATSGVSSTSTRGATTSILNNNIYGVPSTGTIHATTFDGNASTATALANSRSLKVALGSTAAASFDGSADATSIGVSGTLPVARGGTGATSLSSITVGNATKATQDGSGNTITTTYQKKVLYATSVTVSSWSSSSTYSDYGYQATISLSGCTSSHIPSVVFQHAQAISGNYSPVCESTSGGVIIYSKVNTSITVASVTAIPTS